MSSTGAPAAAPKWGPYGWLAWAEVRLQGHQASNARDISSLCSLPLFIREVETTFLTEKSSVWACGSHPYSVIKLLHLSSALGKDYENQGKQKR